MPRTPKTDSEPYLRAQLAGSIEIVEAMRLRLINEFETPEAQIKVTTKGRKARLVARVPQKHAGAVMRLIVGF